MLKDEKILFSELNEKLKKAEISLTLVCVGGFVLDYYGIRGTVDIDAFYNKTKSIQKLIYEIGEKFKLNTPDELWINNSVQNLNKKPPENICKTIYTFSNLKILIPPLEYIAGMKLDSGRENDIEDVASIIKHLKINDIRTLKKQLSSFSFEYVDDALIIEAFGIAYGMEWLKNYYLTHEFDLIDSIDSNHSNYKKDHNTNIETSNTHNTLNEINLDGLHKAFERYEENGSYGVCGNWKVEHDLSSSTSLWRLSFGEVPVAICESKSKHDYITRLNKGISDLVYTDICETAKSVFPECRMNPSEKRKIQQNQTQFTR